jgi:hypothetical protein
MKQKYLVKAGINRYGRQLYLNGYVDDENAWDISVVPIPMSKTRCNKTIKLAQQGIIEISKKFPKKYPQDIEFELVEYVDKPFVNTEL